MYVQGSSRHGPNELGSPFGYLKASSNLTSVNLYVMPYNYPELLVLLSESIYLNELVLSIFFLFFFKMNGMNLKQIMLIEIGKLVLMFIFDRFHIII